MYSNSAKVLLFLQRSVCYTLRSVGFLRKVQTTFYQKVCRFNTKVRLFVGNVQAVFTPRSGCFVSKVQAVFTPRSGQFRSKGHAALYAKVRSLFTQRSEDILPKGQVLFTYSMVKQIFAQGSCCFFHAKIRLFFTQS